MSKEQCFRDHTHFWGWPIIFAHSYKFFHAIPLTLYSPGTRLCPSPSEFKLVWGKINRELATALFCSVYIEVLARTAIT